MKKIIQKLAFGLLLATGIITSAFAQSKIYEFPFDNSYSATVGTGTFTANDSTSFVTDRHGNPNGAIQINNKMTYADSLTLPRGTSPRSISLWVKLDWFDNAGLNILYSYGGTVLNQADIGVVTLTEVWHSGYANEHKETIPHTANTWYHFVFIYDGAISRIYRDGTLIGSSPKSWNTHPLATAFILGCGLTTSEPYFKGAIDDLQIYDYAISAAEVTELYNPTTQYTVTTSANPSTGGTVTGGGNYNNGTSVTLTATPNANFQFVKWTEDGNDVSMVNPYTFALIGNRELVAEFEAVTGLSAISSNITAVYPNPANTALNIELNEATKIRIVDVLGKTVYTQKANIGKNTVDVRNLASGVYAVQTENGTGAKFIKE